MPGVSKIESKKIEEGRVSLKFQDGSFENLFWHVMFLMILMLACLILLHDPVPHPFLCIEESENQL